jgi:predicted acyl esterase
MNEGLFPVAPATDVGPSTILIFERDVPVPVRDGMELRANVYRPVDGGQGPVLMTFGPYGKDTPLAVRDKDHSAHLGNGVFLNWETPDPEYWVPRGYVVVRVDSRGSWASPGAMDPISTQQAQDFHDAIEWAGVQEWSNGKVGLLGISYYAFSQWSVAALQPPHLAAMIPWEGAADAYRDFLRHGGISNGDFIKMWGGQLVRSAHPGSDAVDVYNRMLDHPLDDDSYGFRPELSQVTVPLLSVGNWGNLMLHLRGNVEGFVEARSEHKWLRIITGGHVLPFYAPEALAMQKAFFDRFLKGDDAAWDDEPAVRIAIRDPRGQTWRDAGSWPLPETQWRDLFLDASSERLDDAAPTEPAEVAYSAPGGIVSFAAVVEEERLELTGPAALRIWLSSDAADADVYVRLRQQRPDGTEVFGIDPSGKQVQALAQGWLRASHRGLDTQRSTEWRPWHRHTDELALVRDVPVPLDVEIWPTSIVLERGDRLILEVSSSDESGAFFKMGQDPRDRPATRFDGHNTLHTGGDHVAYLRLPVISNK